MSVWGKAVVRETTKQWPLHGARRHSQRSPQSPQVTYGQAGTKLFENPSDGPAREIISNEIGDSNVTRLIPRCLLQRRYLKPRRYDGVRPALCGARILSTPSTHSPPLHTQYVSLSTNSDKGPCSSWHPSSSRLCRTARPMKTGSQQSIDHTMC